MESSQKKEPNESSRLVSDGDNVITRLSYKGKAVRKEGKKDGRKRDEENEIFAQLINLNDVVFFLSEV